MVTNPALAQVAQVGLDLEGSFELAMRSLGLGPGAAHLLWLPLPMVLVLVAAVVGVLVNVWLERKISAAVQQRIGPEYAGALGVLQPIADALKLISKEIITPSAANKGLFYLGPVMTIMPALAAWAVMPLFTKSLTTLSAPCLVRVNTKMDGTSGATSFSKWRSKKRLPFWSTL